MKNRLAQFVAGALPIGAALIGADLLVRGPAVWPATAAAFGLAFVPALATMAWAVLAFRTDPGLMLLAGLGGSGARMMVSLGGGFLLHQLDPGAFAVPFFLWLAVFYLLLLALEVTLLVRGQPMDRATAPTPDH
jgi:hypothetical protein